MPLNPTLVADLKSRILAELETSNVSRFDPRVWMRKHNLGIPELDALLTELTRPDELRIDGNVTRANLAEKTQIVFYKGEGPE